jgi:ABC-type phosphate transport system auxiliary subunit
MNQKRRVYIVRQSHDQVDQKILSSMAKITEAADIDLSYRALVTRLHRVKEQTGEQRILLHDVDGNPITIEVVEIE